MSFDFVIPEYNINGVSTPPTHFFRQGFTIGETIQVGPTWQDIILKGSTALTLVNAKADSLEYLKLFGGCSQASTPTPSDPVDIVCNNGAIKVSPNLFDSSQTIVTTRDGVATALLTQPSVYNRANCSTSSVGQIIPMGNTTSSVALLFTLGDSYTVRAFVSLGTLARYSWATTDEDNKIVERGSYSYGSPITPTLDAKYIYIQFGASLSSEQLNGCMLVKGTTNPTQYMPYGKIYVDGTTETVQVHGKNLINMNDITTDKMIKSDGTIGNANSYYAITEFIKVQAGEKYTFSNIGSVSSAATRHGAYYSDTNIESYVSSIANNSDSTATITVPANANYLRLTIRTDSTNQQLEHGENATTYEEYTSLGTATATDLLAIGNNKDIQEVLTGAVTRNVGIKVFEGSETSWSRTDARTAFTISDAAQGTSSWVIKSNLYKGYSGAINLSAMDDNSMKMNGNSTTMLIKDATHNTSLADWKLYLAKQYANGNPLVVVYKLAAETADTPVTAQSLNIQAGTNIIEISQASIDDLELEAKYKAGVEVTVEEIEDAQLSNDVTVTIS